MTTFARIAKILKGLVEPRNWVEEAFRDVKVEDNKFHIKITGTVTSSEKYITVRISGDEAANVFNTLNKYAEGDKGVIEFIDDPPHIYPAVILPNAGTRVPVASSEPVFMELGNNGELMYTALNGNTSSNTGVFYVSRYSIEPYMMNEEG